MKTIHLVSLVSLWLVSRAVAEVESPSIVFEGLKAYEESGGKAALKAWLKGFPMENDTTTNIQMTGMLGQIETAYGKMIGFDPVRTVEISPSLRRVYLLIKFERGPLYTSFDCYKTPSAWIIPIMDCNTKANLVFPQSLLGGAGQ